MVPIFGPYLRLQFVFFMLDLVGVHVIIYGIIHGITIHCLECPHERDTRVFPILVLKLVELDKCFMDS